MYEGITPVERMGNFYVKREDLAFWRSPDHPSGSKVRQYLKMAEACELSRFSYPPCIVGCSANSCQQIYVASTAMLLETKGIIYVPGRKVKSSATAYCESIGAEVVEVRPGYLSVVRARAKAGAKELGQVVQWNPQLAIEDTAAQCVNIPEDVKRIIVASGSGLTAAGIVRGLYKIHRFDIEVVSISTSTQGSEKAIKAKIPDWWDWMPKEMLRVIPSSVPYDKHQVASLPDGTPLDPFYSAKAFKYIESGDLFWAPGLRPIRSMPEDCQKEFKNWKGPNT